MLGPDMTRERVNVIITVEVKAMLARGEPPVHLLDDYVRTSMITVSPAIGMFLQRSVETVFDNYVVSIDANVFKEMKRFIVKLPGLINVAMDGDTGIGKQKVNRLLFTISTFYCVYFIVHLSLKLLLDHLYYW